MTDLEVDLNQETRAIMKKGSKTFSFAALLFDKQSREGAELLYTWCRACDDAVDNEPNPQKALAKLDDLREKTADAFRGRAHENDLTFQAFSLLNKKNGIQQEHAEALLDGMQMDVEGASIPDDETLRLYCYRVAGVVGLMMSKIMGVVDPLAVHHAVNTGLAMQMTNIARDIREDFDRERIYIPSTWLAQTPQAFDGKTFAPYARTLVEKAEALYQSGEEGLKFLPLRAALAVGCAQVIYREIGRQVVKRGAHAWDTRTVISTPRKCWLAMRTVVKLLAIRLLQSPTSLMIFRRGRRPHLDRHPRLR